MAIKSRTAFYEAEHVTIRRKIVLETVKGARQVTLPGNAYLNGDVYVINKKNVAVTGFKIGTTATGAEVLAAADVAANATRAEPALRSISRADRTLYIQGTFPANADLGVVIEYTEVPFDRNIV